MPVKPPKALSDAVKSGRCIVFIGSGASVPFKLPNWSDLIISIAEFCNAEPGEVAILKEKIEAKKIGFLEALQTYDQNKDDIKANFIGEKFFVSDLEFNDPRLDKHKQVIAFAPKIITTNYDNILDLLAATNNIRTIVWDYENDLNRVSTTEKFLFKLHGDVKNTSSCILFKSDYEKLYPESGAETSVILKLKSLLAENSCLFWGYSFSDFQIEAIFSYIKKIFKGAAKEHFIILRNDAKKVDLKEVNLKPIPIDSFDEISDLFKSLHSVLPSSRTRDIPKHYRHRYIGRDNEKKEISSFLNGREQFLMVYGPGGIGKTHLVFSQIGEENIQSWKFIRATKDMTVIDFCKIINQYIDESMDYENSVLSTIENSNLKIVIDDFYEVSDPKLYHLVLNLREVNRGKIILISRSLPRQFQENLADIAAVKLNLLSEAETVELVNELFEKNATTLTHITLTNELVNKIVAEVRGYPILISFLFIQLNNPFSHKEDNFPEPSSIGGSENTELFERLLSSVIKKGTQEELELLKDFCVFNEPVHGEAFSKLNNYNHKAFRVLFNKGTIWAENNKYFIHPYIKEIIKKILGENIFANLGAGQYYEDQISKTDKAKSADYIKKAYLHYKSYSATSFKDFLSRMSKFYGREFVDNLISNTESEIIEKIEFREDYYPMDIESLLYSFRNDFLNTFTTTEEKFERFEKILLSAYATNSNHIILLQYCGIFYTRKAKYFDNSAYLNSAIKYLTEALKLEGNNGVTLGLIGQAYRDAKEYEKAIESLNKAIRTGVKDERVYNILGITYKKMNQPDKAIESFLKAIEINNFHIESYNELAITYRDHKNDPITAIKYFDKILKIDKKDVPSLNGKAIALQKLGKNDEAINCLIESLIINPRHMHSLTEIGKLYRIMGKYKLSLKYLEDACRISPKDLPSLSQLGMTYAKMGEHKKAETTYLKALDISEHKSMPSLINLGYLYRNTGRCADLINLWENAYYNNRLEDRHKKIFNECIRKTGG